MKTVVTGSIAYDNIMNFPGYFKEHILPEKIHTINVSFLVNTLKRQRGGCAGNICYTMALLGSRPYLYGTVGQDGDAYRAQLEAAGVDTSLVKVLNDEFTANCYITTDLDNNQITGFYPGAMSRDTEISLKDLGLTSEDLVVISPTAPAAMVKFAAEARELGVPFVYVPAQQIISLPAEDLRSSIEGAAVLIANDYEYEMIRNKIGMTPEDLLSTVGTVITTLGKDGSVILTKDGKIEIPVATPNEVVDPTGAGDAYAAGLVHGITNGYDLATSGRIAALVAVYAIERYGTQAQDYTRAEFAQRYAENFGEQLAI